MTKTLAESFNPRSNSIGFLRWFMALLVIFSHAGPLAGFYNGKDLGTQWSDEQSLGGIAVCGFFFLSGFLITQSRMGKSSTLRFFWRRALRILPGFWLTLLITAFVLGPIAWIKQSGGISGYFDATVDSPLTYFINNMWLDLQQVNIANMGESLPSGGHTWNGSAWTLFYEFRAYILVGVLGMFGVLAHRWIAGSVAVGIIVLSCLQWLRVGELTYAAPMFVNIYNLLFLAPFAFGMIFALFRDKIPLDDRVAVGAIVLAGASYAFGGWLVYGQYLFCYFLIWFAVRATKLRNWERYGDFSYGVYILAWPVMQFVAYFGLQEHGWVVYHLVVIAVCHVFAYLSWHLIEKPAMSLKNWTPAPLIWISRAAAPRINSIKSLIVNPSFSSTHFAREIDAADRTGKR